MLPHHRPRKVATELFGLLLRTIIVIRMKEMRSLRELSSTLDANQQFWRLYLIEDEERGRRGPVRVLGVPGIHIDYRRALTNGRLLFLMVYIMGWLSYSLIV